ncbi:MAG: class I SAM-dependent methyltransferase [Acidimicrobiales bacterium]
MKGDAEHGHDFDDWQVAPNIVGDPESYELENESLRRDGRLDRALYSIAPWDGQTLVDIGCGTGFWLPYYSELAEKVIGVEPDQQLLDLAERRTSDHPGVDVRRGSAERLPIGDHSAHVVHARFAYFFGAGADAGLDEVARVLVPGGTFLAIDNSWSGGDFARLLRASTVGNATIDPDVTQDWWAGQGAQRHEIQGGWRARSRSELERVLRIEFPSGVVSEFMHDHQSSSLSYRFAVYEWRSSD